MVAQNEEWQDRVVVVGVLLVVVVVVVVLLVQLKNAALSVLFFRSS
jgi:predicted RND superfamily exporter protein